MDDLTIQIARYKQQGFYCSQILVLLGLENLGRDDPDLVRAMHGLAGGMGAGEVCGALTGGAALLGLYAGRGRGDEMEDPRLDEMLVELVAWFHESYGEPFGGIRCAEILGDDPQNQSRCGQMVKGVYEKVTALLIENGFDLYGMDT
jgi:C_GCAxxG_C_C family probable redox protein